MLLILAHAHDHAARALAVRWGSDALLLTTGALDEVRWRLEVDRDGRARTGLATAGGTEIPVTGVVNRLSVLTGADLPAVHSEDRAYAGAELTAFLLAWLDACPAPVLNPPDPRSLNGPPWFPEQWAAEALAAGLRAEAPGRRLGLGLPPLAAVPAWGGAVRAHVVGEVCVGDVHPEVGEGLCELGRRTRTPLLAATVSGHGPRARVRDISAWPDLSVPEVADAVLAALRGDVEAG
ncbi:hypothetical protein [Amycolatopsis sp. NPDC004625]|uniref:hypothetical protein n=1 Tax=Amycolatopsis sp. NPDC004625 TaxID=3154670 RepID=UPI0033B685F2